MIFKWDLTRSFVLRNKHINPFWPVWNGPCRPLLVARAINLWLWFIGLGESFNRGSVCTVQSLPPVCAFIAQWLFDNNATSENCNVFQQLRRGSPSYSLRISLAREFSFPLYIFRIIPHTVSKLWQFEV